jgi:pre-mRNA-processing factor 6
MGFTTRLDIGPARDGEDLRLDPQKSFTNAAAAATAAVLAAASVVRRGGGSGATALRRRRGGEDDEGDGDVDGGEEKEDLSEANYDKFAGYGGSLFDASTPYDEEDREADEAYAAVDDAMDGRRRRRKEERLKAEISEYRAARPTIQQQFADLKRGLAQVSTEEWAAIPEATDQVRPHKRRAAMMMQQLRQADTSRVYQRFTPVPDSVLQGARMDTALDTSIAPAEDLTQIGATRSKLLDLRLGGVSSTVAGQTGVDPQGYLTDLSAVRGIDSAEIGDVKKARLLLKSLRRTNPRNDSAWIGSARLEEYAGQIAQARKIITEGTRKCPEVEDVWLEAARLHTRDAARVILAEAMQNVPRSVSVWLAAADLEMELDAKRIILRKALELVPGSVRLWKAAVQLEPPENARELLSKAVECVPENVDMWLALARLETHENARRVLNAAREKLPTEPAIWINAARLEEAHGNEGIVQTIVRRGVRSLRSHSVKIDRAAWLSEAEAAEKAGSPLT